MGANLARKDDRTLGIEKTYLLLIGIVQSPIKCRLL